MADIRDVEAIARLSNYEKHGTTFLGGSFTACTCPKKPCGGVACGEEDPVCPEHSREPAQLWHWAAECPGTANS
jgi:hypothetical protein